MTLAGVWWLVRWIRSMAALPHRLEGEALVLRMGSLLTVPVPLAAIREIATGWDAGALKGRGVQNIVPLAHPNRLLRLDPPISGRRGPIDRIALRVDDPVAFDAAMKEIRARGRA